MGRLCVEYMFDIAVYTMHVVHVAVCLYMYTMCILYAHACVWYGVCTCMYVHVVIVYSCNTFWLKCAW